MDARLDRIQFYVEDGQSCRPWIEPARRVGNRLYVQNGTEVRRGVRFDDGVVVYEVVSVEYQSTGPVRCELVTVSR